MDRRNWPWRKRSSEKVSGIGEQGETTSAPAPASAPAIISSPSRVPSPLPAPTPAHKEQELEEKVKTINTKLATALAESKAKDDLVKQHAKVAEEAVSGWEKAEAEAVSLKEQLDAVLQQKVAAEDRVCHLDGALKECMRQLRQVREEQEQKIHDVIMKKANELDRVRTELEEQLAGLNHQLLEVAVENTMLRKSLQEKNEIIEELSERKTNVEADFKVLQVKLNSLEKENSALRYELHVLNKELEIRNEEREYNRRSTDATNKQFIESTKKIAKLESECQKLRVLVRKKLPGPAAVAQMKMEVEMLEKDAVEGKRKRMGKGAGLTSLTGEFMHDNAQGNSPRQIHALSEQLLTLEEENKILKQTLTAKINELQVSRVMCARTASKLSQLEVQMEAVHRGHRTSKTSGTAVDIHVRMSHGINMSNEPSIVSISEDGGNGDEASCAESWASALISELAQFKKNDIDIATNKAFDSSEFNLMNDFVEMERLAALSTGKADGSTQHFGKEDKLSGTSVFQKEENSSAFSFTERNDPSEETPRTKTETNAIAVAEKLSAIQSQSSINEADNASLQEVLCMVFEAYAKSQNMDEVMERVKAAIVRAQCSTVEQVATAKENINSTNDLNDGSFQGIISDNFSPKSHSNGSSSEEEMVAFSSHRTRTTHLGSKVSASIHKILILIKGFIRSNPGDEIHSNSMAQTTCGSHHYGNSSDMPGYTMRVLQWQNSEFDTTVQSLVNVCTDLLHGKADIVEFVEAAASTLDWLVNHFFSLQDVSSIRATIKKQFEWEEESHSVSESEVGGTSSPEFRKEKTHVTDKKENGNEYFASTLDIVSSDTNSPITNGSTQLKDAQNLFAEKEIILCKLNEEISRLNGELSCLKLEKEEIEERFRLANENTKTIQFQLQESEQNISRLQSQLSSTMEGRELVQEQLAAQKSLNEKLASRLSTLETELTQSQENCSSFQAELEGKHKDSQELEAKCLSLQSQLERLEKQEMSRSIDIADIHHSHDVQLTASEDEMKLKKEREIAAAAEKLAECQKTILVLGKQLKDLASPTDSPDHSSLSPDISMPDKLPPSTTLHPSLLDHMQADNKCDKTQEHNFSTEVPKTKEILWPRTDGEAKTQQELDVTKPRNTGLLYGWQVPIDTPRNSVDQVEKQSSGGNSDIAATIPSPAKSPGRFLSIRTKGTGNNTSKSTSSGEAVSMSPSKHTHNHSRGGFSRFFSRTRNGH